MKNNASDQSATRIGLRVQRLVRPNRVPREKPDTIEVRWAKHPDDRSEDMWSVWHESADKGTSRLCMDAMSALGKELEKRGYDLRSLRFSVKKLPNNRLDHTQK